jgi:hypothetical protein
MLDLPAQGSKKANVIQQSRMQFLGQPPHHIDGGIQTARGPISFLNGIRIRIDKSLFEGREIHRGGDKVATQFVVDFPRKRYLFLLDEQLQLINRDSWPIKRVLHLCFFVCSA